jgi:acetolactate decarboxylase
VSVDPGLALVALDRAGAARDPAAAHVAFQVSTLAALLDGRYEGELTLAELTRHGDLGIGTLDGLDGELAVLDGECWQARADGTLHRPDPATRTPFAVVVPFTPGPPEPLAGPLPLEALCARLDALRPAGAPACAVRVDGRLARARLRSVPRQSPPYRPLAEVARHQAVWETGPVEATIVGFRFPAAVQALEVPGWHLHLLAADRSTGGHVLDLVLERGTARLDGSSALHLELPPGVVAEARGGGPTADAIRRIEQG